MNSRLTCLEIARGAGLDFKRKSGHEHYFLCPCHLDRDPSLKINETKNCWMCGPCGAKGNAWSLTAFLIGCNPSDEQEIAQWLRDHGLSRGNPGSSKRKAPDQSDPDPISSDLVEEMHLALTNEQHDYLKTQRLLSEDVIDRYKLGYNSGRVTIPIVDHEGFYRDVRRWLPPEHRKKGAQKILHWKKGYGASRLFPIDQLNHDCLLILEGELDTLAAISHGMPAITVTAGASTWPEYASEALSGKTLTIAMDNDEAGRDGARKRAESLIRHGCKVLIATWPENHPEGWDATDELGDV